MKMTPLQQRILVVTILASFVAFLDNVVVNVALPAIAREFDGGLSLQQWVVNAYSITLGALMLVAGSLSDLFGRKRVLGIGLVAFGLTSLLCALAPNGEFLIGARALQGAAGALLVPSSLAIIISSFSGAAQSKAIGIWTAWTVVAPAIGPLVGGLLVDTASWRLIFLLNIPMIAGALWVLKHTAITTKHEGKRAKVDSVGALLCVFGLGGIAYALIEQLHFGWGHPMIYLPLTVGVLFLAGFIWHERRTSSPMMPLELFRVRNFSVGNIATSSIYGGLAVSMFLITIFIQQVGGFSATEAGLALLPVTVMMFTLSPIFGKLAGVHGPRLFMALGPALAGGGFLAMLMVGQTINYWTDLLPGVLLFGLGLSMTVAPLTAAVLGSVDRHKSGIGSAINNAVSRISGLLAIAVIGVIVGDNLTVEGFHEGLIFTALLLFGGGFISFIGIRNPRPAEPTPPRAQELPR